MRLSVAAVHVRHLVKTRSGFGMEEAPEPGGLCGNVCLSAQHSSRGGSLARLLLHAARSVDRVLSGAAQLAEGGGER